jgi:hypothetical protein
MIIGNQPPIDLRPHTLVIVPQGQPFVIEGLPSPQVDSTPDNGGGTVARSHARRIAKIRDR